MRIAIIPARGGSKRIPHKNKKVFAGEPIIAWVIRELIESKVFSQVIVSTDDLEIAEIAQMEGALVPFMRPTHLSDDYATTGAVVVHALQMLQNQLPTEGLQVCTVYPTAVFADRNDYVESLSVYEELTDGLVFSVGEFATPIERSLIFENLTAIRNRPDAGLSRSQDLPTRYFDAGQFYWASAQMWERWEQGSLYPVKPYVLPKWKVHDIDTIDDWELAEMIFTNRVKPLRGLGRS
jgi:N-acylneuraminate cytidylyltransferase